MTYTATHHKSTGKFLGRERAHNYWLVANESGEYARITDETVSAEDCTAEDFAKALAFALNNDMPTSALGGMTPDQYRAAKEAMESA